MKDLGMQNFRMSISWPRIFPQGKGEVNLNGLAYYNNVIDLLVAAKVKPYVTLYHWDYPAVRLLCTNPVVHACLPQSGFLFVHVFVCLL
jgi:beta-glucosidase/6-phospho-beta-glucosidase/beta-galactosidase